MTKELRDAAENMFYNIEILKGSDWKLIASINDYHEARRIAQNLAIRHRTETRVIDTRIVKDASRSNVVGYY